MAKPIALAAAESRKNFPERFVMSCSSLLACSENRGRKTCAKDEPFPQAWQYGWDRTEIVGRR
jgi:hypothetical protein